MSRRMTRELVAGQRGTRQLWPRQRVLTLQAQSDAHGGAALALALEEEVLQPPRQPRHSLVLECSGTR